MALALIFIDREPISGHIFSGKRSKLLKIAAKTMSMGSAELFQRRLWFYIAGIQSLIFFFLYGCMIIQISQVGIYSWHPAETRHQQHHEKGMLCNSTLGAIYFYLLSWLQHL
jgi:hypothetical protein